MIFIVKGPVDTQQIYTQMTTKFMLESFPTTCKELAEYNRKLSWVVKFLHLSEQNALNLLKFDPV